MIENITRWISLGLFASATLLAALPDGWNSGDVGAVTPAGTHAYSTQTTRFDLAGAGADIWGTADQFHYVYEAWTGDGEYIAQIASLQNTNAWAKAGLMVRENLSVGSRHAMLVLTPGNGVAFQRRKVTNGSSLNTNKVGYMAPVWLKLIRKGNQFDSYTSADGQTWTYWMTDVIDMPASVLVGLAVTSHRAGVLANAVVTHFTATAPLPADFPGGWLSQDIGTPVLAGSGDYLSDNSLLTIRGAGVDIWGTADQFNFASCPWTGDAVVIARVDSLRNTNPWAKAGVMIRESLAPGARNAFVALTPGNGVTFQRRITADAGSLNTPVAAVTAPAWVKLERWVDRFDAYYSLDGLSWTWIGSQTIPMTTSVYLGLAVTSHSPNVLTEAVFSHFDYHRTGAPGGLWGQYFSGKAFNTCVLQRLDGSVNFAWGAGSPDPSVPLDNFSARWTGWLVPDVTQTYTFSTVSDDGVRLWINNQLVIDNWTNHGAAENTASVALQAGQPCAIKMEYYENTGSATAKLLWSAADRGKAVIPVPYLIPSQYPFPVSVVIVGGDNQSALAGSFNANPLDVAVWKSDGSVPLSNAFVSFTVASGGGLLANSPDSAPANSLLLHTDADGTAQAYYRQPTAGNITSHIIAASSNASTTFTSTSLPLDLSALRLSDSWQMEYFGHLGVDPDGNPIGDGMSNLYKFVMGLNPLIDEGSGDKDGDGISNNQDARPNDQTQGQLSITISTPVDGTVIE